MSPSRVAMALAAGLVCLVVPTAPSVAATDRQAEPGAPSPTWSASPLAAAEAALGPGRAGHQGEQLHRAGSPGPDGSPLPAPYPALEQSSSKIEGSPDYTQILLGGLAGVTLAAAVAGALGDRRRHRPQLEATLADGGPDELSRAAGLLGDLLLQQHCAGAAEHAYRAAVDVEHEYWSPIAQVALARCLRDQGDLDEADALFEAVIATGHPRAVPMARAGLRELDRSSAGSASELTASWG